MKYRAEIDGLRAIAVLPVILFHAGFEIFGGGFIGVDVFFVISGYLITTILMNDLEDNRFSLIHFYERRARRILPALFIVMIACIPFAWMWMLPDQMKDFSHSLIAVSLFASNFLFWQESDYFAPAAEEKPLLHTWSLAVEEQYYLIFPIFLLLAWRLGKNKVFWIICAFAAISLMLSEWGWRNEAMANFYLPFTRAWELFAGSIAAFIVNKRGVQKNNILAFAGFAAILFAIFAFDKSTPFPSVYALVPIIGTMLLILYAHKDTVVAKILSVKIMVGIGLISYSAYLWHQPFFAFARIRLLEDPSHFVMLGLSLASILFAALSWKYVEQPFRHSGGYSRRFIFIGSFVGLMAFIAFGAAGHLTTGFQHRINPELGKIIDTAKDKQHTLNQCHFVDGDLPAHPIEKCASYFVNDNASVMLMGDSHLDAIGLQIQKQLFNRGIGSYAISYGCVPFKGLYRVDQDNSNKCHDYNNSMIDYARETGVTDIILIARFPFYLHGNRYDNGEGGIETGQPAFVDALDWRGQKSTWNDVERVQRVTDIYRQELLNLSQDFRVHVFTPVPEVGWNVPDYVAHNVMFNGAKITDNYTHRFDRYQDRIAPFMDIVASVKSNNLSLYDVSEFLCDQETGQCAMNFGTDLLYRDDDHLSVFAAEKIAKDFVQKMN